MEKKMGLAVMDGPEEMDKKNGLPMLEEFENIEKKNEFATVNGFAKTNGCENADELEDLKRDNPDHEHQKKRALEDHTLPQWGHKKRSKCTRGELKKTTDKSTSFLRKTIQVEPEEHELDAGRAYTTLQSSINPLQPSATNASDVLPKSKRSASQRGASASNKSKGKNIARKCIPDTAQRGNQLTSLFPGKDNTAAACPSSSVDASPRIGFSMRSFDAECDVVQSVPLVSQNMNLDQFEWPRVIQPLSRKEKEEDFMILRGCKLPLRPKRRPKVVEEAISICTPGHIPSEFHHGLYDGKEKKCSKKSCTLGHIPCDLHHGRYDGKEKKCSKKKPRGLKAMESNASDSD